ncbi:hypothetical protein FB45DRAFT_1077266 [Roridomyces roridus]|uniref:Uncharacterized protein n=1 Tax=Roridomyces roridus TaxID=1738132 RepID=A0AAD7CJG4_9AGAR|nr:hypothetical protein FB45DRAFT_1077266 [Roridomyces roridus]
MPAQTVPPGCNFTALTSARRDTSCGEGTLSSLDELATFVAHTIPNLVHALAPSLLSQWFLTDLTRRTAEIVSKAFAYCISPSCVASSEDRARALMKLAELPPMLPDSSAYMPDLTFRLLRFCLTTHSADQLAALRCPVSRCTPWDHLKRFKLPAFLAGRCPVPHGSGKENNVAAVKDTLMVTPGQIAKTKNASILGQGLVLPSNTAIRSSAYTQLLAIAESHGKSTMALMLPYHDHIAPFLILRMCTQPHLLKEAYPFHTLPHVLGACEVKVMETIGNVLNTKPFSEALERRTELFEGYRPSSRVPQLIAQSVIVMG